MSLEIKDINDRCRTLWLPVWNRFGNNENSVCAFLHLVESWLWITLIFIMYNPFPREVPILLRPLSCNLSELQVHLSKSQQYLFCFYVIRQSMRIALIALAWKSYDYLQSCSSWSLQEMNGHACVIILYIVIFWWALSITKISCLIPLLF